MCNENFILDSEVFYVQVGYIKLLDVKINLS
jgi:hypothetical protein